MNTGDDMGQMNYTQPTSSTRAWERRRDAKTAELRREVKAKLPRIRDRRAAVARAARAETAGPQQ